MKIITFLIIWLMMVSIVAASSIGIAKPTEIIKEDNDNYIISKIQFNNFISYIIKNDRDIIARDKINTSICIIEPDCKIETKKVCHKEWVIKDEKKCDKKKKCEHVQKEICADVIKKKECNKNKLTCTSIDYENKLKQDIDNKIFEYKRK